MPKWDAARLIKALTNAGDGKRGMDRMLYEINADIDALTAERDELQRRLDAVVRMLEPKKPMPQHEDFHPFDIDQWNDAVCDWQRKIGIHARAVAIAEGRAV